MSILNVNQIQPVGSGQTVTINAANISAGSATVNARSFSGNVTGNINSSGVSTITTLQTGAIQTVAGKPLLNSTGSILQVIQTTKTNVFSTSSTTFVDVTGLSASITPSSTSSKVLVLLTGSAGVNGAISGGIKLVRGSTDIFQGDTTSGYTSVSGPNFYGGSADANNNESFSIVYLDSPTTTSSVTYKAQVYAPQGGTLVLNGLGSDIASQTYSMKSASSITLLEVSA
jgi:hypothetical protein